MSRSKSKAKSAAAKQRVSAQVAHPARKTKPPAEQSPQEADAHTQAAQSEKTVEHEIPLDLLCDVALRLAESERVLKTDKKNWSRYVRTAFSLIQAARDIRCELLSDINQRAEIVEGLFDVVQLLTEEEQLHGGTSFERGCQIATGIKNKKDAVTKFRRAFTGDFEFADPARLPYFESEGFGPLTLLQLRRGFLRLERTALRKPYERSGKYIKKT